MKKLVLILLTLVPILAGALINASITPLGMLLYYALPILVLVFWFWLGGQYAGTDWGMLPSVLIGSATGIASLVLYVWQFCLESEGTRNPFLAGLSQMYAGSIPLYVFSFIFRLLKLGDVGQMFLVHEVLAVILMAVVFLAGYRRKKQRNGA